MGAKRVLVVPYDGAWAQDFIDIKSELEDALKKCILSGTVLGIEHVGSTSVPGLSAKPIIDIDIIIKDRSVLDSVIGTLDGIGYRHEGDLGIPGREAFKYDGKTHLRRHHLYVCAQDSAELKRHLAFRDHLRSHPDAVREYSRVKEEGASLYPDDIDKYIAHKSPFIEKIYRMLDI